MDALKAKLRGAQSSAQQKLQRKGLSQESDEKPEGYYAFTAEEFTSISFDNATEADTSEDRLEFVLDVINYATIWAAQLMLAIEEQQRAAWDPTRPDHVGPTYGGR